MEYLLKVMKNNWKVVLLIVLGVVARIFYFGTVPGGINQDEAFAGYEAYSLLNYGIDSSGYHIPVYFVSWGSGMNVLNSYIMIPFIKLFGLKTWVIRLPQVLVSCISLVVFYFLLEKIFEKRTAIIGLFIFAICPWHIMMSRWGLESNLAPGFLLLGLYFFVLGVENNKYMIFSALFYGIGLYTYATIWPVTALIILLSIIYCWYARVFHWNKYVAVSWLILIVVALPLLLFLMVNKGIISEIKTSFISIPKMVYYRGDEVSIEKVFENIKILYRVLVGQSDGLLWNETTRFGLYYKFSLPFILIGSILLVGKSLSKLKTRTLNKEMFVLFHLVAAGILSCLVSVNVNRVNCIHIPILICLTLGIRFLDEKFKRKVTWIAVLLYLVNFVLFSKYYLNEYNESISVNFQRGLEEAVDYAIEFKDTQIYITDSVLYSKVLFYSKMPTDKYVATVKYANYPSAMLQVISCGNLHFGINIAALDSANLYIINNNESTFYKNRGYKIVNFENFSVAYMG